MSKLGTELKKKPYLPPIRLIDEAGFLELKSQLCDQCITHTENIMHLPSGRLGLHLMTDAEVKLLGEQVNYDELLQMLRIEKGKAADTMITQINTHSNPLIEHDLNTIKQLLSVLDTDFYQRYSFNALQNLILEDRRIRIINWVS